MRAAGEATAERGARGRAKARGSWGDRQASESADRRDVGALESASVVGKESKTARATRGDREGRGGLKGRL